MNMMYGYGYGMPDYGFGIGHILNIVLWIFVIIFLIKLFRARRRWGGSMLWGDHAVDILKERYAKGEISKEEYEERKRVLMEGR